MWSILSLFADTEPSDTGAIDILECAKRRVWTDVVRGWVHHDYFPFFVELSGSRYIILKDETVSRIILQDAAFIFHPAD